MSINNQMYLHEEVMLIALKDEEGVTTESKGEGEDRHIIIKLDKRKTEKEN